MIGPRPGLRILIATQPVDGRRGINGLTALVAEALRADPYSGDIFVFRSKRTDRVRFLVYDGTGMMLTSKWLEEGRFTWPPIRDGAMPLTQAQFEVLVAGLDWTRVATKPSKRPLRVA
jgi:transposase